MQRNPIQQQMETQCRDGSSAVLAEAQLSGSQIDLIKQTVGLFSNLSRRELARTVCELLSWRTAAGEYRIHWCLAVLEAMEGGGEICLPDKDKSKQRVAQRPVRWTERTTEPAQIDAPLRSLMPVRVEVASCGESVSEWNEWVDRYHYLGYRRPIGPNLRYFIVDGFDRKLGALLFSYASRKVSCRDAWIGWSEQAYKRHLDKVVCNSRFVIFPWVQVKCLASKSLSLSTRRLVRDWQHRYGYRPLLVETYVDKERFDGVCYRAANWQCIGDTRGRTAGRSTPGRGVKAVYVYPLARQARERLCGVEPELVR